MSIQSSNAGIIFVKYFMVICFIVTFYHLSTKFLPMLLKKFVPEYILKVAKFDQDISPDEIEVQLLEVQKLAHKISSEKDVLKSILFDITNDDFRQEANKNFADLHDQIKSRFEAIDNENKARCDQVQGMILNLVKEVSDLKARLIQTDKILRSSETVELEEPLKCCKLFSESSVQTDLSYESIPLEISDCGLTEDEWMSLKQCMSNATTESEKLWKDAIIHFFTKLEQEYESTKYLVLGCWDEINGEIANCGSVLDKVHHVEQTVFGILIFLQQQSVNAQTVKETLKFFDHKFQKFMQRTDTRWKKSYSNLQFTFESVKKAHTVLNVGSLTFKNTSVDVTQKLAFLKKMVTEFGYAAKLVKDAEHLTHSMEKAVCDLVIEVANLSSKLEGAYSHKISILSEELLVPGEKLYVLYKTLDELNAFATTLKLPPKIKSHINYGSLNSKHNHSAFISDEKTSNKKSSTDSLLDQINIRNSESFEDALKEIQKNYNEPNNDLKIYEIDEAEKDFDVALGDISNDYLMESCNSIATGRDFLTG